MSEQFSTPEENAKDLHRIIDELDDEIEEVRAEVAADHPKRITLAEGRPE